jgi:ParB-like chromosome segregation protein Spo0J
MNDVKIFRLPLGAIRLVSSPRLGPMRRSHLSLLAATNGNWPPILVNRGDNSIVDGRYRFWAAQALGQPDIRCTYFEGDPDSAFLEAVRRNIRHGLPLSLRERKHAARQVLKRHSDWSDRRVARVCGLSADVVADLRPRRARPTDGDRQLDIRVGRDGRRRPVDAQAVRDRVVRALEERPSASLREIARTVGTSPETVRSLRARLTTPSKSDRSQPSASHPSSESDRVSEFPRERPPAVFRELPVSFMEWFDRTAIHDEWRQFEWTIPAKCITEIEAEARRRARTWTQFAMAIHSRPHTEANVLPIMTAPDEYLLGTA